MSPVDAWAAAAASLACATIGVRAHMLRPRPPRAWAEAPWPVWSSLSLLALSLGMRAVTVIFGAHAAAGEAMVDSGLALAGAAMLWNLNRNGRIEHERQAQIRRDVATVMDASGPPKPYPWENVA